MTRVIFCLLLSAALVTPQQQTDKAVESFEIVWTTLRDQYWDRGMAGLNWQQMHDRYLPRVKSAWTLAEARQAMSEMIHRLPSSHLALIPGEVYGDLSAAPLPGDQPAPATAHHHGGEGTTGLRVTPIGRKVVVEFSDNPAVHPGWVIQSIDSDNVQKLFQLAGNEISQIEISHIVESWLSGPIASTARVVFLKGDGAMQAVEVERKAASGKLVEFTNLPPEHVVAEHRKLSGGVGYIYLNIFLDPVSVMPEFEQAIADLRSTPGIVLDLRGNPGGLGIMAMGLAGWFVSEEGQRLGTMLGRKQKTDFEINPRIEPYTGKLAILVDGSSASTAEILAQGLKDLGRARIFGTRTAGAALPSNIIELPDGDRFQYPEANYTSFKGRVLEGNGVDPDVVTPPTISALLGGHDLALESAIAWIQSNGSYAR